MPWYRCSLARSVESQSFWLITVISCLSLGALPSRAQTAAYGTWTSAGQMTASRSGAAAATLQDGRILIAGGSSAGVPLASAEIYNGSSFAPAPSMSVPRTDHTIATLNDGRVIVAGGYTTGNIPTNSIEIYNPVSNTWSIVPGGLSEPRAEHTMTVMQDGRVLVAGGMGSAGQPVATLEIFDPKSNASTPVAVTMSSPRMDHAASLLPNGAVLLAGGFDGSNVLSSVDAFDPSTSTMGSPLNMASPRRYLTATTLLDGRVLLAGGNDGTNDLATLEIANLASESITLAGSLTTPRSQHSAIRLPDNGGVLIAGGESAGNPVASAELFSPVNGTVQSAGSMSTARFDAAAAWLAASGKDYALVAGGDSGGTTSTGDVYSFPFVQTDKPEYAPNTTVTVTGKGWAPGETVTLVFHESPSGDPDVTVTSTADATGSFQNTDFAPDHHDEGVNLILTATGSQSGATAQTAFADSTYPTQMINLSPATGQVDANITVSATLQYGVPYYVPEYYYYSCDCYSCDCGWFSCDTCCNTCEGVNYVFGGYDYYNLPTQAIEFYFNIGSTVTATTDDNGNATASITVPPGATQINASFAGSSDGTYGASVQTVSFTATPAPTSLAAASSAATYGTTATLSATLTADGNFVNNETVSFSNGGSSACSGTTNTLGVAQCSASLSGLTVGSYTISASFAGDSNYQASSGSGTLTVTQATQTITFPSITGEPYTLTSIPLSATASSGLPVSYSSTTPAICTVSGSTASLLVYGECTIQAAQAGNANYDAAPTVSQTFLVHHTPQTISFAAIGSQWVNTTLSLSATASSSLPVSFTSTTTGICTVSGTTASLIATGTCTIEASQAGNDIYQPAGSVERSFSVTTQPQTISFTPITGEQFALTSAIVSATASSGLPVTFSSTTPAVCTVSGSTASLLVSGNCTIEASQAGSAIYAAAPTVSQTFLVHHATQTITFAVIPSQAANTTLNLSATASSSLPVTFTSTTTSVCTVSGTTALLIAAGTCTIEASQAGNNVYQPAASVEHSFSVTPLQQTIIFTPITGEQYASTSLTLSATASSGLPVTISSTTPTVCTVSGTTASLIASGNCIIEASQAGNSIYAAAPSVSQTFLVHHATQTISFAAIPSQGVNSTLTLSATASSSLPVSFTSTTTSVCTVSGTTASLIAAGTCTIEASQAGNNVYQPAVSVERSFSVTTLTQTISFPAITGEQYASTSITLSATASSGLPVTFSATASSAGVCTVSGATASLLSSGNCILEASQAGNAIYAAAPTVSQIFLVHHASQTITFAAIPSQVVNTTLNLSATASSSLAVTFTSITPAVCTVSGSTASLLVYGNCTIEASQAGNASYAAAPTVSQTFLVHHATQTINFAAIGSQGVNSTLTLSATASSSLPVSFTSTTPTVCTVSGTTASLIATGTCTIEASQAGNDVYQPAVSVERSFSVTTLPQTISFPAITGEQYALGSVTLSATASSSLAVTFSSITPAVCAVSGSTVSLLSSGDCTIEASQAGSAIYAAAPTVSQTFLVHHATQTISFAPIPSQVVSTTLTLSATASSSLPVSFSSSTPAVCTVSGTTASLIATGTCSIEASQAGNSIYQPADLTRSFSVTLPLQTISFTPITGEQFALTSAIVSATASSGLPVTFSSITPAVCTVSGSTASLLAYGNCIIEASQAGNSSFAAAPTVSQLFLVHHTTQTISFAAIPSQVVNTTLTLSATASSGLPVSFTSTTTSVCTVSGTTASLIATGTCSIEASQAGNNIYQPAVIVEHSFSVTPPLQTISFPAITGEQYASTSLTLSATASSGLPVTFSSTTPAVCTVSGSTASLLVSGNCTIEASQAGNGSYAAAPTVSQTFLVHHATQTISFAGIGSQEVNATLNLSATASSSLPVTFTSTTTSVCTVSGTTASLIATGTCTIEAAQAGNNVYQPAASVEHSFSVTQ
jgi:Bacterial Ig-like domain (group 3)/Kelch motif